ncbi:ADP-ribose pyrophosphatase [Sphaerochaeta pleomorpha str. Grapes]|uniref:ADP-ribose pyrophosphatase n=1 Tax=Sphaerochaeta pleomorpha (strain ATCC BAA-1885 / DSM 22778 / Grapes) TaxID=158190 RepID=G8QSX4_SPHPG|nr:NUDIX hydrolase [Sphaerochaeta pleomorpha]AEV30156.1 ADP-ribose pyrophosphatase [Sphaerochaeta pleomorpha str. Grapes]
MKIPYHGAGVLLWAKDEDDKMVILLGKRSINPEKGKWSIPGGGWDLRKDSFDDKGHPNYLKTAIKETNEELHFLIEDVTSIVPIWRIHIPAFHFAVYSFQLPSQRIFHHNYEFFETKWFPAEALPPSCVMFVESQVAAAMRKKSK